MLSEKPARMTFGRACKAALPKADLVVGLLSFLTAAWLVVICIWIVVAWSSSGWRASLEPAVGLLAGLAAIVGFSESVVSTRRRLLHKRSTESPEDESFEVWRPTNHSVSEIEYEYEFSKTRRSELKKAITKALGFWIPVLRVDRLLEDTTSLNYRVLHVPSMKAFLLRAHPTTDESRLAKRHIAATWLHEECDPLRRSEPVFSRSFVEGIVPLALKSGGHSISSDGRAFFGITGMRLEVLPFIDNVEHFSGEPTALASFAEKMGMLERCMRDLEKNEQLLALASNTEIAGRNKGASAGHRHIVARESGWSLPSSLLPKLCEAMTALRNRGALRDGLVLNAEKFLEAWIEEIKPHREALLQRPADWELLVHDLHPHNAFFRASECVLIYDLDWLDFWPSASVPALSLHRFVRECVRRDLALGTRRSAEEATADYSTEFLKAYARGRELPNQDAWIEGMLSRLGLLIADANIDKTLNALSRYAGIVPPWIRTRPSADAELRKFLSYLKEATKFPGAPTLKRREAVGEN